MSDSSSRQHQHQPAVRPEDVLPESIDSTAINGLTVRKVRWPHSSPTPYDWTSSPRALPRTRPLVAQIRELVPALRAIGLNDVFRPRSPAVERILADAA
ncbi:hypothetical protein ACH4UR_25985 [Streptomyces lydicus]|uniref:hypothetical protein n=1 Tax=Streptomyces lydicus TaxID=47763 RepID=UPI0033CBD306